MRAAGSTGRKRVGSGNAYLSPLLLVHNGHAHWKRRPGVGQGDPLRRHPGLEMIENAQLSLLVLLQMAETGREIFESSPQLHVCLFAQKY